MVESSLYRMRTGQGHESPVVQHASTNPTMCGGLKNTEVSARWGFPNVGSRGDVQGIEERLSQVESFLKQHASYRGCRSRLRTQLRFRTGEQRFPPYGAEARQVDVIIIYGERVANGFCGKCGEWVISWAEILCQSLVTLVAFFNPSSLSRG